MFIGFGQGAKTVLNNELKPDTEPEVSANELIKVSCETGKRKPVIRSAR